jgi:hypothetical protein
MKRELILPAAVILLVSGAGRQRTAVTSAASPPTAKDVIRFVMSSHDVKLSVDSSCSGVGVKLTDTDIGDYLAGFLAEQTATTGQNWLEVKVSPEPVKSNGREAWECSLVIRRKDGEERWGWGVRFLVDAGTRKVIRGSFRCTGAG